MKYLIGVRALCEFTAKQGDLDLRFTPSPSAQEGIQGHQLVTARRPAGYEVELSLGGEYRQLSVRGRADGYDAQQNQLEEIKTFRGDLARMPDNHRHLHWAQLKIYGALLCQARGLQQLRLALVYFDILSQKETLLCETHAADHLQQFFEAQCECFLAWAQQELAHRAARDTALAALAFPHAAFRPGQRELAAAVYKAAGSGRVLMAQAPTGIGKTIGTLFPLLKACPTQGFDKIFFLAAKTPGRALALDAARLLKRHALPLRVLELVARDKACAYPELACHGDSCPLARGFYDRLPQARAAALELDLQDRASLREVALAHQVCPYYLSQDLVRWSDVVVGDYNYYFDLNALLPVLSEQHQWRVAVLVDEAHNLLERARKMYSAQLDQSELLDVRRHAPAVLKKPLDRLQRSWNGLLKDQQQDYCVYPQLPEKFLAALQNAAAAIGEFFADQPTHVDAGLQKFWFELLHFARLAELFDTHTLFDITRDSQRRHGGAVLCLRNVIPAPFLAGRLAAARSVTMFSATLSPWHFYSDTLGLSDTTAWIDVASPFAADQLEVNVAGHISTRFRDREQSLAPIVALMAAQYVRQPGNYLAFFSSYDYLQKVALLLRERFPEIPLWEQERRMDEAARDAFLARFAAGGAGIGFAVLGGAFAEGIDLPGDRLIGAFIATLGLPQINPVNEQIRQRLEALFGNGYDYAYLYPGMQKVVQAAGRVIRSEGDRGVVYLIDERFRRPAVQALLPPWWKLA